MTALPKEFQTNSERQEPSVDRSCGGLVPIARVAPCKCDKPIER